MTSTNAWVATAATQQLVRQEINLGPLEAEEVEVQVENCGLCHSNLSMRNNDWGATQYHMLSFAARHNIAAQTEHFPMSRINDAFERLESGKARYRIVLDADF